MATSNDGSFAAICRHRCDSVRAALRQNNLGRRVLKNTIATTITMIFSVIPPVIAVFGVSTFLSPLTTVFGHPGQSLGMMVESLILIVAGTVLGVLWSLFGIYLSTFVFDHSFPGGYTIRAIFLVVAVIFHGYLRSHSPRLFVFVLFHLIVATLLLTNGPTEITAKLVTDIFYPILTAVGVIIVVNIVIFPETASTFVGKSTIQTLFDTATALKDAGDWFIEETIGQDLDAGPTSGTLPRKGPTSPVSAVQVAKLAYLSDRKAKLRTKLTACKKAQAECNFELSYSVLPPRYLKPISSAGMTSLVQSTIALIGACESKYVLVTDSEGEQKAEIGLLLTKNPFEAIQDQDGDSTTSSTTRPPTTPKRPWTPKTPKTPSTLRAATPRSPGPVDGTRSKLPKPDISETLRLVKPKREVESGDAEILELILTPVRKPIADLKIEIDRAVEVVTASLSYCYDVRKLPSGWVPPDGIRPEEIDIRMDIFQEAIDAFDRTSAMALASAAALEDLESPDVDIMPRMETFLISSFLLSLRQAAIHTMHMLKHSRDLVERRHARRDRRRLYFPRKINWKKWLSTGGEEDNSALPDTAKKGARRGEDGHRNSHGDDDSDSEDGEYSASLVKKKTDEESPPLEPENVRSKESEEGYGNGRDEKRTADQKQMRRAKCPRRWSVGWFRWRAADFIEELFDSEDLSYALKMAVAVMLVTWPAFVQTWKPWYSSVRGVWVPLQLIMVFEVAIGTSFWVFFVRLAGVVTGCIWGFLSCEIGGGNPYVLCVICMLGVIPGAYVQVGTKYVKAGMIGIISMNVVALVSYSKETASWEIFLQRLVCFIIGGTFAIVVELVLYPVRARDRLVECLSGCIRHLVEMQAAVAVGVDDPKKLDMHSPKLYARFRVARDRASASLTAAETFLPFCLSEPRLKGSFKTLAPLYKEIIYVLHQIIDRMDNVLTIRKAYGSSVLEELNSQVYTHRRNVAASVTLTLFAINEALTTRMPLPQFLPSSRLAQLRLVNKVRHILMERSSSAMNVAPLVMTAIASLQLSAAAQAQAPLELSNDTVKSVTQMKFLSWNAAATGQIEIIEYLEELVDLTKLLVGVNAFRSGMLERPSYNEYIRRLKEKELISKKGEAVEKAKARGEDGDGIAKAVGDVDRGLESGTAPQRRDAFFRVARRRRNTIAASEISHSRNDILDAGAGHNVMDGLMESWDRKFKISSIRRSSRLGRPDSEVDQEMLEYEPRSPRTRERSGTLRMTSLGKGAITSSGPSDKGALAIANPDAEASPRQPLHSPKLGSHSGFEEAEGFHREDEVPLSLQQLRRRMTEERVERKRRMTYLAVREAEEHGDTSARAEGKKTRTEESDNEEEDERNGKGPAMSGGL